MPLENSNFYEFGPYRIDTVERRLLRGDEPIPLTPKAYDTLLALVENAGNGLKKDELMRRVWPDTFVEESGLIRNISVLRKALGDEDGRYIETLPKHGYRLHPGGSGYPLGHLAVAGAAAYFAGRRGSLPVVRSLAVLP